MKKKIYLASIALALGFATISLTANAQSGNQGSNPHVCYFDGDDCGGSGDIQCTSCAPVIIKPTLQD